MRYKYSIQIDNKIYECVDFYSLTQFRKGITITCEHSSEDMYDISTPSECELEELEFEELVTAWIKLNF